MRSLRCWQPHLRSTPPPPPIFAQSPPETPSSVTVTRADGTLTASGYAVSGAAKYHITYTTDNGASWHAPVANHTNWTSGSITFNADNSKTYIIGVRAGNDNGWSGWRNSASSGPYTPPQPTPTPTPTPKPDPTPTPTPQPQPPGAVASVSLTRADGTVTASWNAVSGATKYHITYTADNGGSWHAPVNNHTNWTSTSVTFGADNAKTYIVGVRAGNADGWSGWVNSPATGPYTPEPTPTPTPEPTATPTPEPTPTPVPAPARPTGLTATAGDESVTLAWNDPADTTLRGYEYQVNHNDTATGNLSGWGPWTMIASNATSYTVTGLTNGKEYRFKLRAVNKSGLSNPAPGAAPWYVAATPAPPPPPAAPSNVAVNPGSDSLAITWDAVSEATGYDVRAKAEGASNWHDVASNISATSYTYTTSNTMDYIGVRARNANGVSAWTDVSRMPADDLLNVATGISSDGASAQSVQGQSQLDAPTWGTVTRAYSSTFNSSILDINWTTVNSAIGYNIICSGGGWQWHKCGWDDDGTVKYTSVPSGESQPVTVSHYRRGSESRLSPGDFTLGYTRSHMLAIRAVNANPAQASAWVNTPLIHPIIAKLENLTYTRTAGQVMLSWSPNRFTAGYEVYCDNYTSGQTPSYTLCATLTNQDGTAASHSVTITKAGGTHNWSALDDTSTLDIAIDSTNAWGKARFLAPLIAPPVLLTVSNVGVTTATLTIANHSGDWYYQANAAPDNTCQGPVSGSSKDLTGLSAHTAYDYAAYSDRNCTTANELATAAQFTTLSSVSSLGSTKESGSGPIHTDSTQAVAFSISSTASSSKYTLKNVTLPLRYEGGSQSGLTVKLHGMRVAGQYSSSSQPSINALADATFTGTAPTSNSWTDTTWTCSGNDCELDAGKTYFIVLTSGAASPGYGWAYALTESETALPSGNGWSIGYGHFTVGNSWRTSATPDYNIAEFVFAHVPDPSLSTSNVTVTGATLTISDWNEDWYYKANTAPHTTCQGPVSGASKTLSGLTSGTDYTYTAYSDSTCTTANELATAAQFTTLSSVSNLDSTKGNGASRIHSLLRQAVAFTTGTANTGGYVLKSVTLSLRYQGGTQGYLSAALYKMEGSDDYSASSKPERNKVPGTTLTGTAPTSSSFTNTTFTCSGDGCKLDADQTYFVMVVFTGTFPGYGWAWTETQTETRSPSNNGWSIEFGHSESDGDWSSFSDYSLAEFVFANAS